MIYPKCLKDNDMIGITAPSNGLVKNTKIGALENAIANLKRYGFRVCESDNVRRSIDGVSGDAKNRAKSFMEYITNQDIKCIIAATGGDFLVEILEYINFEEILKNVKWVQGQSDITALLYILTTGMDIATIYSYNITGFGYKNLHESQINNIKVLKGDLVKQHSFDLFENPNDRKVKENSSMDLSLKTCWKAIGDVKKVKFRGRIIGGCLDCLLDIVGTKYDYTKNFIDRYKMESIIWYFDVSDLTNEDILRGLWQLKNAGWFQNASGIMFGRLKNEVSYTGISLHEAISRAIKNENIPILTDVDLGHTNPRITIVNGAIANVEYKEGRGNINLYFV